jgi:hypothetical protein
MDKRLALDELIDVVRNNVTLNCMLPYTLGNDNIERIIKTDAMRYFYREYKYANQRTYYYADVMSMYRDRRTDIKFLTLPDEIEAVRWIYLVNYQEMQQLGFLLPQNSVSFGMTSQPYIATVNVGEWAQSMTVMQSFQDALSMFNKNTVKFSFDPNSKRFEVQTSLHKNLVLEVWANISEEALFGDPYFIKYVTGQAMIAYSMHLSFVDMQLAGNSKIATDRMYELGKEMVTEVKEYLKLIGKQGGGGFFFNKTR